MARKKKFTKMLNVPVEDAMYDAVKDLAEKHVRSLADMTRIVLDRLLEEEANNERSFRDEMIIKEDK